MVRGFALILTFGLVVGLGGCSTSPEKYVAQGTAMFQSRKYEKARVMYLRALEQDARNGMAYVQLGLTDEKLGDHGAAIAAFRRALNLIPADRPVAQTVRIQLADLYLHHSLDSETIGEAARTAGELLGRNPNDYDGRRIQALVSFKAAQWFRTRDTKAYD